MLPKFVLIFALNYIFCRKYPLFDIIEKSKKGKIKTIDIDEPERYIDYVKLKEYVVTFFTSDWCEECQDFLPIFDEASRYKIINKKWIFLKVDCATNSHVCMHLGVEQYPTTEIYIKNQLLNFDLPMDLAPLLELLYKLSTNPIIRIKSKEEFFKKYGYYTPIIEIDSEKLKEKELEEQKEKEKKEKEKEKKEKKRKKEEEDNNNDDDDDEDDDNEKAIEKENEEVKKENDEDDFLTCITKAANTDFIQTFYFGLIESKDYKEKIVFDNDNMPITYLWDGICQNALDFLSANKYPLLSKVDKYLFKEFEDELRLLVTIITFPDNPKINYFINTMFKKLAFDNRKHSFGYVNYEEDPYLFDNITKIELNNTNEIQFIINDFIDKSHYLHKPIFNIENQTEKEIYEIMKGLIANISNLNFITGSKIQDFVNFIGINKMDTKGQIIFIIVLIAICLGCVYFFGNPDDLDDEYYEYEEEVVEDPSGREVKAIKSN